MRDLCESGVGGPVYSAADRKAASITPYGSRHLLPSLTRTAAWPIADRNELGRWNPSTIEGVAAPQPVGKSRKRSAAGASVNAYSRGPAGLTAELKLRVLAIAIVRDFIVKYGAAHVPAQCGEDPTFQFLLEDPTGAEAV